ncbi:hypothetical protein [Coleofasciculus sp. FACHB-SPT9]|nr:hypothetical protein [Coleofasciculus sp. FACHB-SPT9]
MTHCTSTKGFFKQLFRASEHLKPFCAIASRSQSRSVMYKATK